MDPSLVLVGVARLLFGVVVAAVGITLAARLVKRWIGLESLDEGLAEGRASVGIALGAAILAMGILVQHAVSGTFGALSLLTQGPQRPWAALLVLAYAAGHIASALAIGAAVLAIGTQVFVRLTPSVDEIAEIRSGNTAYAIVLAAVLLVLALLAQQGVEAILDGLLPLPELGRDRVLGPR